MKLFYKKDLVISLVIVAVMICAEIIDGAKSYSYITIISWLFAAICGVIWSDKYDKYDKEADIFGFGFRNRFPRFVRGQERMNIYALNTYMWMAVAVLSPLFGFVSLFEV